MKIFEIARMGSTFLSRVEEAKADHHVTMMEALDLAYATLRDGLVEFGYADTIIWREGQD